MRLSSFQTYLVILFSFVFIPALVADEASSAPTEQTNNLFNLLIVPDDCALDPLNYSINPNPKIIPKLSVVTPDQGFHIVICLDSPPSNELEYKNTFTHELTIFDPQENILFKTASPIEHVVSSQNKKSYYLTNDAFFFVIATQAPQGIYKIKLTTLGDNQTLSTSSQFELVPPTLQAVFENSDAYEEWINSYYQNPNPLSAITAYLYMSSFDFSSRDPSLMASIQNQCAFYFEIFRKNAWTLPYMANLYQESIDSAKFKIIFMLTQLGYSNRDFYRELKPPFDEFQKWAIDFQLVPISDAPDSTVQIDMLWAQFMATGRFEPIQKIVQALNAESNTTQLTELVAWSLQSNIEYHPLVREYCLFLQKNASLNTHASNVLSNALNTPATSTQ